MRRRRLRRLLLLMLAAAGAWLWRPQGRPGRLFPHRPDAIILHHSATPWSVDGQPIDATAIDAMHARRGFGTAYQGRVYHIGYHYVILPDGAVQPGRPEGCVGAHARHANDHSVGICLVGNFSSVHNPRGNAARPTRAQLRSLLDLCEDLGRRHGIGAHAVRRHCDVGQTACPGDRFPFSAFQQALTRRMAGVPLAAGPSAWWRRLWPSAAARTTR